MSLDVGKLEKARELAGGIVQARCPACAEGGGDRKGEHLRIYPDGRYGCCVHPKDGEHRKRIFALAGARKPGTFTLRLKTPPALPAARSVKAALATPSLMPPETELESGVRGVRAIPTEVSRTPRTGVSESKQGGSGSDASDGAPQVQTGAAEEARTLRTGYRESNQGAVDAPDNSRTLRTPLNPSRGEELYFGDEREEECTYKEFAPPVRSVREEDGGEGAGLESLGGVRGVRGALLPATMPAATDLGTLGTPETESENGVPGVPAPPSPVSGVPNVPADGFRTGRTPVSESVKAGLAASSLRTLRTAVSESVSDPLEASSTPPPPPSDQPEVQSNDFRTGRTGISKSRARTRGEAPYSTYAGMGSHEKLKDLESAVLPVLSVPGGVEGLPPSAAGEHLPYLTPGETLVIPSDSPERYHWWKPPHDQRLRVKETLAEVKERMKNAATV